MENLKQGQEISEWRDGYGLFGFVKLVVCLTVGLILADLTRFYLKDLFNIIPNGYLHALINLIFIISSVYYYNYSSNWKENPSVSFFSNYLLVRYKTNEVEVPFKMIKRFRLLENKRKIVVSYKE